MCLECFSPSAKRPWKITAFATAPLLHSSPAHTQYRSERPFELLPIGIRTTEVSPLTDWVHFSISYGMWCCDGGGADEEVPLVVAAVADAKLLLNPFVVANAMRFNNVNRKEEEKTRGIYVCTMLGEQQGNGRVSSALNMQLFPLCTLYLAWLGNRYEKELLCMTGQDRARRG